MSSAIATGTRTALLQEICEINPRRPSLACGDKDEVTFIPMSAVAEEGRGLASPEIKPYGAVKKGYTHFREGDVLFAKITPCMQNGKHAIVRGTRAGFGFGSTEFHVVRPGPEISAEWLHYFLIQPRVLHAAAQHFKGAVGQQRVPDDFLRHLCIPLPPLSEQRKIAAKLEAQMAAVAHAKAAAQQRLAAAERLPSAVQRTMFAKLQGSKCDRRPLGELCSIEAGQVDPRDRQYAELPHVNGENIVSGTQELVQVRSVGDSKLISGKYLFRTGNVLYSKLRPYLRKVCVAPWDGLCSADMYPIHANPDCLDAGFLSWLLLSPQFTEYAMTESARARMPKLNREQLLSWMAPIPPIPEQRAIAARLRTEIRAALCIASYSEIDAIQALPAALLREAFGGGAPAPADALDEVQAGQVGRSMKMR